ncbi:hybrid sensor histidine kinase/response regulator [Bacteroides sp. 519]|nr:hybrid sensor histidine kinase/response regulator [Bacteroides sp. 519]
MPETSYYGGIHSITKDSIGRIWFSGYDALFVYNGNSFTPMNDLVTSFLPGSYWSYGQVITDASKRLYVCTNHGLLRFNYQTKDFELLLEGNIGSITSGDDGTIWLVRDSKIESFHSDQLPDITQYPIPSNIVVSELICTKKHFYVASTGKLYRLNKQTGEYNLFATIGGENHIIKDVIEHNESVYILTHMDGLFECDSNGQIVKHYNLSREYDKSAGAKKLYIDSSNTIWMATQTGLFLLDPYTEEISLLRFNLHDTYSLPNNSVWSIYPDPDGGVWIGTYGGKLAYITFFDNNVNYFKATPGGLNHPIVSCFEEDKEGNLWIGTEGGGLNYWDRKTDRFSYYTQGNKTGITSNMIKRLRYDRKQNILQISAFNGGMEQFDDKQHRFIDLQMHHPGTSQQLSVYDFEIEGDSGIWMTDPDARLMYKDKKKGTIEVVSLFDSEGNPVRMQIETLFRDQGNNLWLITHNGAYIVDVTTRRITKHYYIENAPYAVNNLCSFCITSGFDIWFGTRGGGVNRLAKDGSYTNFGEKEGLLGKTVFGILEDDSSKDVWFSTNDGLYYYDFQNRKISKSAIEYLDLCGAFYVRSCYKTLNGEMLFGGTNGFIMFTPSKIKYNNQKPKVFFTDLLINNERIIPGTKGSPLTKDISTLSYSEGNENKIVLSHKQSNIEICVSANSYLQAEKNQYAYRMLGLSDQWSFLPRGQKAIQFFNLPAGDYIFEVKAANNDDLWGNDVAALYFKIKPSPFLSVWAYIVYGILVLFIVYFIWRYFTNKKIFKHQLEMEQMKEQNMKKLTQARINFFTNISHDLKTPLSLVIDPLKQLKEFLPNDQSSNARTYVNLIERNINRIQRMISQLLQFREIESQKITFNLQSGDLIQYIGDIFSLFELYANKKGIETDIRSDMDSLYTRFDHDAIEKIITNLFSNAIKYTSENGFLGVKINRITNAEAEELALLPQTDAEYISVAITNTGTEIPDDKKEEIFESFKRLTSGRPAFEDSTGLGLSIVKELVSSLNGVVTLQSGDSKVTFTVVLPFPLSADKTNSNVVSYEYTVSEIDNILTESEGINLSDKRSRKASSIVVIEDDPALRTYMEQRLSEYYNVYTATNGVEGIAKTKKIFPQIVITDLMMPEADGFDVCHNLRSNIQTSHIPIVVLSAMGQNTGNKIKALESGANVFIDKPFDMDFLLKQVDNLIKNQNELKELYSKKYIAEPSKITISSMDEELLKRAMECIERNIANCDYNVESFVSDMGIGRTLLYQKISDIVGMSIKEFIMDVRLKRAAQLLKESDLTISEIADKTGFNNPKYFSICFKKHFELTPSEFKKRL